MSPVVNGSEWTVQEVRYSRQATDPQNPSQLRAAYVWTVTAASGGTEVNAEVEVTEGVLDYAGGRDLIAPSSAAASLVRAFVDDRLAKGWIPKAGDLLHMSDADVAFLRGKAATEK